MIYILFPTGPEARPFLPHIEGSTPVTIGRRNGFSGRLGGADVTALVCGIGQANAAQAATVAAEAGAELIVLCGSAGAYQGAGIKVGSVVVATSECYADTGVAAPEGWLTLASIGLPLVEGPEPRYAEFPVPEGLTNAACAALKESGCAGDVFFGPMLTVATVSGTAARGRELFIRHGALCENMEGAAAAQIAALYGVPFMEIRGISNQVEDRDRSRWDIPLASEKAAGVAAAVLRTWVRRRE